VEGTAVEDTSEVDTPQVDTSEVDTPQVDTPQVGTSQVGISRVGTSGTVITLAGVSVGTADTMGGAADVGMAAQGGAVGTEGARTTRTLEGVYTCSHKPANQLPDLIAVKRGKVWTYVDASSIVSSKLTLYGKHSKTSEI
jgi:hypothetical protein